jgi:hypothetical protein
MQPPGGRRPSVRPRRSQRPARLGRLGGPPGPGRHRRRRPHRARACHGGHRPGLATVVPPGGRTQPPHSLRQLDRTGRRRFAWVRPRGIVKTCGSVTSAPDASMPPGLVFVPFVGGGESSGGGAGCECLVDHLGQGSDQCGQLNGLETGPRPLDRVELGGIGGQPLDHQPGPLGDRSGLGLPLRDQGPSVGWAAPLSSRSFAKQSVPALLGLHQQLDRLGCLGPGYPYVGHVPSGEGGLDLGAAHTRGSRVAEDRQAFSYGLSDR